MAMDIFKEFRIEAAHKLTGLPLNHKCGRLHGHSFAVELHVRGSVGDDTGWVIDFADIKKAFEPLHERLDHHYLNDVEGLSNPTSENIARWIWCHLQPSLPMLCKVVVRETCTTGCIYQGEDE
jgi:6-pyruvoyltetrahydropterin/6-carboxytetrahydropterin synthase